MSNMPQERFADTLGSVAKPFSELDGARRGEYYAAVRAGMDRKYRSMKFYLRG